MAKQILIKDSKLKDLKPDPSNPRTISEEKLSSLRKSLEEFGDLSCIVYNELEDKLVSAHQRIKTWNPNSKIVITNKYKKPNKQGTIREGYVEIEGEKFKYRVVRWTAEKHKAAMLAANKHSGEWDQKKLNEIVESLKASSLDFNLTGFEFSDFPKIFPEHKFDPNKEWTGMPEFDQEDATSFRHIIVHFENQDHVNEFFNLIKQKSTVNTKSIWFPEKKKRVLKDKLYE